MKTRLISEKGQYLAQFVILLPLLIGFMGLVVDVGNAYARQRRVQNAADAAATAGGMVLYNQGTAVAENAARYYANLHGYSGGAVQVSWPTQCIRVQVTENVTPIFASIVWNGTFPVQAAAQACYRTSGVGASVIVLNRHDCKALNISGSGLLQVRLGNVHVNSDCATAIDMSGSADLITQTPTTYVGGYKLSGGAAISPAPVRGSVLPDPLASLPVPAACNSCPSSKEWSISKGSATLSPGCFMGGIKVSGGSSVTFQPGVYCIGDKGLDVSGSSSLTGSGVTFYLADGGFKFSGGTDYALTPPSSGDYAGILFFQARNNSSKNDISGGTDFSGINGVIYLPAAELKATGGSTMRAALVVDTLDMSGGANLDVLGYQGAGWTSVTDVLAE